MTDTAQLADIVLPVTYFMEETDVIGSSMWNGYLFYNQKMVSRYYDAKPELEIYSLLAGKMGLDDFPQLNEEQWLDQLLSRIGELGIDKDELRRNSYAIPNKYHDIPWNDYQFKTPSGKFEFIDAASLKQCYDASINDNECTYRLITVHTRESLHSQHFMTSEVEYPTVYIGLEDAKKEGIEQGQLLELHNQYGHLKAIADISGKCQPGLLFMKEGWWKKSGGSVNCLTPHGISDIGGQAIYNECRCEITKTGVRNE